MNNGVLQITAGSTFNVNDNSMLGKWVDGEVRYLNTNKKDPKARFFFTKNKKTVWIKEREDKPTPKPATKFECPPESKGKKPQEVDILVLSYGYGGAVAEYQGLACLANDQTTGDEYWVFKDTMTVYGPDYKDRWFNGDVWYNHIKPTKKIEGIQLFVSNDKKTLKKR
ncbi:expressed protein [Dictyostelium purpureum]|uniref:Expressed protein n=1 Tax=Dictyostelium purpureum TaxID=5786 RepID=F0ZSZ5_DICPU|nr:uncharacterized protein DICPUDRAFT_92505 [Dictyostelium purpureum]EGC32928.1 expressed protein [Dictyostelium purpureum]|eukprot:XP_003290536.1 expressed protein [Dictyostelium purpureum]